MVFLSVFEIQGELVLAPADLKPTWCWEFSGQVGLLLFCKTWDSWEPAVVSMLNTSGYVEAPAWLRNRFPWLSTISLQRRWLTQQNLGGEGVRTLGDPSLKRV